MTEVCAQESGVFRKIKICWTKPTFTSFCNIVKSLPFLSTSQHVLHPFLDSVCSPSSVLHIYTMYSGGCWSCRSTSQLQRWVSEGRFWRWNLYRLCAYLFGWVSVPNHTMGLSLAVSSCLLCCHMRQPNTVCTVFSLFFHTGSDEKRKTMISSFESAVREPASHFHSLPQNTIIFGSHVYLHPSNFTFCNVLFHSRINHSALPFLGHRLQIDYLSGVQCND